MDSSPPRYQRMVSGSDNESGLGMDAELEVSEDDAEIAGRWWHRPDLDRFLESIYQVYDAKGWGNIVTKGVLDHLNILFVLFVVLFLAVVMDFRELNERLENPCNNDEPVDLSTPDCHGNVPIRFGRLAEISWIAKGIIFLFLLGWLCSFVWFLSGIGYLRGIRDFYQQELKISHRELQTCTWSKVVDEISKAQSRLQLCTTTDTFDKLDVTNLISRKKNFLIALYGTDIINSIAVSIPFVGPKVMLPHSLQWNLEKIIFRVIIFDNDAVVPEVWSDPDRVARSLEKYFKLYGAINLLLAPCILVFQLAYFFFHNSDSLRRSAGPLATRQWSPYACWMMRNYSETEHAFRQRLQCSYKPANCYVESFVSEMTTIWARFLVFIFGGLFVILTALGFIYDEDFLFSYLTPERSVIWWTGVIGALLAVFQSVIPDDARNHNHEQLLSGVSKHTNFFRESWKGRENSLDTFDDFTMLYQLKGVNFLEELASILYTPYLLLVQLPSQSRHVVEFFQQCSYKHPYLPGHFCRFAFFRMNPADQSFIGSNAESLTASDGSITSSTHISELTSKMEYSVAAFNVEHPDWRPSQITDSVPTHNTVQINPAVAHQDRAGGTVLQTDPLLQPLISE